MKTANYIESLAWTLLRDIERDTRLGYSASCNSVDNRIRLSLLVEILAEDCPSDLLARAGSAGVFVDFK